MQKFLLHIIKVNENQQYYKKVVWLVKKKRLNDFWKTKKVEGKIDKIVWKRKSPLDPLDKVCVIHFLRSGYNTYT